MKKTLNLILTIVLTTLFSAVLKSEELDKSEKNIYVFSKPETSFDCDKAEKPFEQLICSYFVLADYELKMTKSFNRAKEFAKTESDRQKLIEGQNAWLKQTLEKCQIPENWDIDKEISSNLNFNSIPKELHHENLDGYKLEDLSGDKLKRKLMSLRACLSEEIKQRREYFIPLFPIGIEPKHIIKPALCNPIKKALELPKNRDFVLSKSEDLYIPEKYKDFSQPEWKKATLEEVKSNIPEDKKWIIEKYPDSEFQIADIYIKGKDYTQKWMIKNYPDSEIHIPDVYIKDKDYTKAKTDVVFHSKVFRRVIPEGYRNYTLLKNDLLYEVNQFKTAGTPFYFREHFYGITCNDIVCSVRGIKYSRSRAGICFLYDRGTGGYDHDTCLFNIIK